MAFTAGSVELTKAQKLANQLSNMFSVFGTTGSVGSTGARKIEKYARKLGFGITGLTTGTSFPPFGSALPSFGLGIEAALQNPRGETMANGITLANAFEGQTVGIFVKKYVRSGADFNAVAISGVTLALGYTSGGGGTFTARGPFAAHTRDRVVFNDATYTVVSGFTSATSGSTAAFRVQETVTSTYATGAAFNISTVGITRGTAGYAGSTFESFAIGFTTLPVPGGLTATIWFDGATGTANAWRVS